MRLSALSLLTVAALCVAPAAFAEPKPSDDYGYRFDDDYMVGDTLSTTPPLLVIPKRLPRLQLIRPRASFVSEMLKSVEAL